MDCTERLTIIGFGVDGTVDPPIPAPVRPRLEWKHIAEKRLFALTHDGETEYWRDNPTRSLVVEPDFNTGEMQPVLKGTGPSICGCARRNAKPVRRSGHSPVAGKRAEAECWSPGSSWCPCSFSISPDRGPPEGGTPTQGEREVTRGSRCRAPTPIVTMSRGRLRRRVRRTRSLGLALRLYPRG